MKNPRIHGVLIVAIIVALAVILSFSARNSRGQSPSGKTEPQNPKTESLVKPTALITERPAANANPVTIAPFAEAAAHNSLLRNDLIWEFGRKGQRGWYLYDLLIGKTLNISHHASSGDFASAIAGWQKQKGLSATGVLDEDSWMALVAQWQANRLKDKTPATPDQLLTAPISDFYDPTRLDELRQVERNTYAAYKAMLAAAIADPTLKLAHTSPTELAPAEKYFKIISSFRSREYQEKLRRESPKAGSAGLAVNSPHFTGRALDIYVGGDPVDTKDANRAIQVNTPVYKWLVKNAERFGFRPYFYEPWHWEYVK
ncbi:MAG TPA: D-alanyl-D-alanine carboxypeptidase family protein [Pyrinomonadaceae bacterium]|nr:D-alanyl-D-alanine carboxypeptidase family protein [Pyrinomonadaceae bacterium]